MEGGKAWEEERYCQRGSSVSYRLLELSRTVEDERVAWLVVARRKGTVAATDIEPGASSRVGARQY